MLMPLYDLNVTTEPAERGRVTLRCLRSHTHPPYPAQLAGATGTTAPHPLSPHGARGQRLAQQRQAAEGGHADPFEPGARKRARQGAARVEAQVLAERVVV